MRRVNHSYFSFSNVGSYVLILACEFCSMIELLLITISYNCAYVYNEITVNRLMYVVSYMCCCWFSASWIVPRLFQKDYDFTATISLLILLLLLQYCFIEPIKVI